MSIKRVNIQSDCTLEGVLRTGDSRAGVVICHPHPLYGGSMLSNVVEAIEEGFSSKGFTTLRFNFRGVGGSNGVYGNGDGETNDLEAALRFLKENLADTAYTVCAGYSFGAWICARVAGRVRGVDSLFLIAYPFAFYPTDELRSFSGRIYFVGGTRDEISPADSLLELYKSLPSVDKYLKMIATDHFYGGKEREITEFIRDQVSSD